MCGIAGYIGTAIIDPARIDRCLRAMHHRGPDHSAAYHHVRKGRHVHLLHSRLSIIDLDPRANQPMKFGDSVMVFNGALYNYRELARRLDICTNPLCTSSDTEILLRVLVENDWSALSECEGMWAFAVYNERTGELDLCRDRFGEKPLHLFETEHGIYFGSEVKFIRELLGRPFEVNVSHLHRFMVNGYKSLYKCDERYFKGLKDVPPATIVRVHTDGTCKQRDYWHLDSSTDESMSFDEAAAGLRERLIQSVEWRMRSDVPVAFLLSGGVDSNSLLGIARRVFGHRVSAFTVACDDERYDERHAVSAAADELNIDHVLIELKPQDTLEPLRRLVRHREAPLATISYYAQSLLMQAIAEAGCRVVMSGVGADELLTGYYDHHNAYLASIDGELHSAARREWSEHIGPAVRNPHLRNPDLFIENAEFRDHIFLDADVFAEFLTVPWSEPFEETKYCSDLLRNRMRNELHHEIVPVMLHEDDANAMQHGLENRSPFLDRSTVEWCCRIPTRHLIREGFAKAVLREAMRNIAPESVLSQRRKTGFNAPIASMLNLSNSAIRRELLDDSPIFQYVHRDAIARLLDESNWPNSRSKFLFNFVNCKLFLEECAA